MTGGFSHILAAGDNGMEIVIGVIIFIIWAISGLAQAATKQQKKQRQKSRRLAEIRQRIEAEQQQVARRGRQINPTVARRQPAVPTLPVNYGRTPAMRPPPAIPPARRVAVRRPAPPPVSVTPVTRLAEPAAQTKPPLSQTQVGSGNEKLDRPKPLGATAQTIAGWLKPATLRQQFILTEIFQPPVALRDSSWDR